MKLKQITVLLVLILFFAAACFNNGDNDVDENIFVDDFGDNDVALIEEDNVDTQPVEESNEPAETEIHVESGEDEADETVGTEEPPKENIENAPKEEEQPEPTETEKAPVDREPAPKSPEPVKVEPKVITKTVYVEKKPEDKAHKLRTYLSQGKLKSAERYLSKINFVSPGVGHDRGELYHFKGVTCFLLAEENINNESVKFKYVNAADEAFRLAHENTMKTKFKPLSLLWRGMLMENFYWESADKLSLGLVYLNMIIKDYPTSRFANDAEFYKALIHTKLGKRAEAEESLLRVRRGGYEDDVVYWKRAKNYISSEKAVSLILKRLSEEETILKKDNRRDVSEESLLPPTTAKNILDE